jgi:uncharacterized DUF497 family protein
LKNWSGGFEWNEEKAEKNLNKHRVSFYEATTVYDDFWLWLQLIKNIPFMNKDFI